MRIPLPAGTTLLLLVTGCATGAPVARAPKGAAIAAAAPGATLEPAGPLGALTGVWDWTWESRDPDGDTKNESEEWHLEQRGDRLIGYYDRAVTWFSNDGRAFVCNRDLRYTKITRFQVSGRVRGRNVELRETAYDARRGPCDDGQRQTSHYQGALEGGVLQLSWGTGMQRLIRRDLSLSGGAAAPPAPAGARLATAGGLLAETPATVTGGWRWSRRGADGDGDQIAEREEWHLVQAGGELAGYYDRVVVLQATDGRPFECSGEPRFEQLTRYQISGRVVGDAVVVAEIAYEARPSGCDDGHRTLSTYRGTLAGDELVLSWGGGDQVLHRIP